MKSLTQFELNNISAGVHQGYGSFNNSGHGNQPEAGLKEDFISGAIQALGALVITAIWNIFFPGTSKENKKENDTKSHYGRYSSSALF